MRRRRLMAVGWLREGELWRCCCAFVRSSISGSVPNIVPSAGKRPVPAPRRTNDPSSAGGRPTGLLAAATSHTRCRCRVLFLTRLAARPTVARAPRRPCTVDELRRRSAGVRAPFRHRTRDRPYRIRRLVRTEPKSAFCAPLDGRRPGRVPGTCFVSYLM